MKKRLNFSSFPRYRRCAVYLRFDRGFSAIELMVVISIIAILVAIAIPSFISIIAATRVRTSADTISSTLYAARSEAVKRAGGIVIRPGANWSTAWTMTDANGILLRTIPPFDGVVITHLSGANVITVDRWGRFSGGGALAANFSVVSTTSTVSRAVCVSLGGRITQKTTGSTCP